MSYWNISFIFEFESDHRQRLGGQYIWSTGPLSSVKKFPRISEFHSLDKKIKNNWEIIFPRPNHKLFWGVNQGPRGNCFIKKTQEFEYFVRLSLYWISILFAKIFLLYGIQFEYLTKQGIFFISCRACLVHYGKSNSFHRKLTYTKSFNKSKFEC